MTLQRCGGRKNQATLMRLMPCPDVAEVGAGRREVVCAAVTEAGNVRQSSGIVGEMIFYYDDLNGRRT